MSEATGYCVALVEREDAPAPLVRMRKAPPGCELWLVRIKPGSSPPEIRSRLARRVIGRSFGVQVVDIVTVPVEARGGWRT
jgi:hypothetical protein